MGCLTWLVSKKQLEYCDLGKIGLDEKIVRALKRKQNNTEIAHALAKWLVESVGDLNEEITKDEAEKVAAIAGKWMAGHLDWRFISEYDDTFDDVYLAEDDADAKEYLAEFGKDANPIYRRTGTVWPPSSIAEAESLETVFGGDVEGEEIALTVSTPRKSSEVLRWMFDAIRSQSVNRRPERLREPVHLYFEVALKPGEETKVRPHRCVRMRARRVGQDVSYGPPEEVDPEMVALFRPTAIGPIPGDSASLASWTVESGIHFLSVRTSSALLGENLAPRAEPPAFLVAQCRENVYMTAKTAADVSLRLVNRGKRRRVFSGVVEGITLGEE